MPGVGGGRGGMAQNDFSILTPFFKIQFENTSNLILLGFKVSSESFLKQSYLLKYVGLKIAKLGPNVFPYQWDTLYLDEFYQQ